jgi:hypothetical protein
MPGGCAGGPHLLCYIEKGAEGLRRFLSVAERLPPASHSVDA